jgi:hypothetical protein
MTFTLFPFFYIISEAIPPDFDMGELPKKYYDPNDERNMRLENALEHIEEVSKLLRNTYVCYGSGNYVQYIPLIFYIQRYRYLHNVTYNLVITEFGNTNPWKNLYKIRRTMDIIFNTRRKTARFLSGFTSQGSSLLKYRCKKMTARGDIIQQLVSHVLPSNVFKRSTLPECVQRIIASYM